MNQRARRLVVSRSIERKPSLVKYAGFPFVPIHRYCAGRAARMPGIRKALGHDRRRGQLPPLYRGEIGHIEGFRFIESDLLPSLSPPTLLEGAGWSTAVFLPPGPEDHLL